MKRIGNLLLVSSLALAFGVESVSAQTFNDGDAHSLSVETTLQLIVLM